jgi:hypothetical protein
MLSLRVLMEGDGALEDVSPSKIIIAEGQITLGALPAGMVSGKPSVFFLIPMPDGKVVFAELSLALLQAGTRAMTVKYGDQNAT